MTGRDSGRSPLPRSAPPPDKPAMPDASPLFVAVEPTGAAARSPATRIVWACDADAGTAGPAEAARRIAALTERHPLHLADPLFDAPRLAAAYADAKLGSPPKGADWLLALAPFGQARNLAALLEAAAERAAPDNPAERLLEAWRGAREHARKAQPKT